MQETFGVKLEAITSGFKAKMQEATNFGQQMANKVKQAWNIEPKINTKNLSTMTLQTQGLKDALSAKNRIIDFSGPAIDGLTMFSNKLSAVNTNAVLMKNNIKDMSIQASSSFSGMGKGVSKLGSEIGRASKRMLRFGLSVLSIRGIFSMVSRASRAYLEQDTALAGKLQSAWAGLGAFLAPLIEKIANMILKLVGYMNIFIKAVTGQDLLAKASAKATAKIKDQTKATKGLNKSLTDMDEITNIQDETSGAGGGADITNPFDNFKDVELPWADKIKAFGEWFGEHWPLIVMGLGGIALAIKGLKLAMKGPEFLTFGRILGGIGVAILGLAIALGGIKDFFDDVKKGIEDSAKGWFDFGRIITGIGIIVLGVGIAIASVPVAIIGAIVAVLGVLAMFWPKVKEAISNFKDWIINFTKKLFGDTLGDIIIAPFVSVVEFILDLFDGLFKGVKDIIGGIMKFFQGDVKGGFIAIGKGLANIVIGAVNSLIDMVNFTLAPIRGIIVAIGNIAGKKITMEQIKLPKIPLLNTGTNYVPEDQMAYIHKGEAVIPKKFNSAEYFNNNNEETNDLLVEVNRNLITLIDKDTNFYINGREFAQATYNDFQAEGNRLGQSSVVSVR